jgi:hypothetical protein
MWSSRRGNVRKVSLLRISTRTMHAILRKYSTGLVAALIYGAIITFSVLVTLNIF